MRAVVQRVKSSEVLTGEKVIARIGNGLNVLLGVEEGDTDDDIEYMAEKIAGLRIFEDDKGKMNLSLYDTGGEILVVSQFTLLGDCRKGKRPNFMHAAKQEYALNIYNEFIMKLKDMGLKVSTGIFQAIMLVKIDNDGPVTILIDSRKRF